MNVTIKLVCNREYGREFYDAQCAKPGADSGAFN